MIIEAMNSKAITSLLNKMRPNHATDVLLGNVNAKIRSMHESGMLSGVSEIPARGSEIFLTKDDVVTVLMTYRQYDVPEQVRKALGGETATTLATSPTAPSQAVSVAVVSAPASAPAVLRVVETDGVQTMSSLDMVSFINSTREPHAAELRHADFLAKVPTVIKDERKFSSIYYDAMNRPKPLYNFPKREAMLMAMSYSYTLQATVYDAWEAAEAKIAKFTPAPVLGNIPNFDDPIEAAEAWIAQRKQANVLKLELSTTAAALTEAQPKVAFHDAVVADDSMHSLGDAIKLIAGAGMGRTAFIKWLKENKYLQPDRVPYQRHINAGILDSSFRPNFVTPSGRVIPKTTYVTGKGIAYFQPKIAKFLEVTNG